VLGQVVQLETAALACLHTVHGAHVLDQPMADRDAARILRPVVLARARLKSNPYL
jgi:hypothetical protein